MRFIYHTLFAVFLRKAANAAWEKAAAEYAKAKDSKDKQKIGRAWKVLVEANNYRIQVKA